VSPLEHTATMRETQLKGGNNAIAITSRRYREREYLKSWIAPSAYGAAVNVPLRTQMILTRSLEPRSRPKEVSAT
jgi:hypothetical protein